MDKPWVGYAKHKRIHRFLPVSVATDAFLSVASAVPRIKPAAPAVDAAVVFPDTVKRGEMVRQVRGTGTLVPETVAVIAANDAGRVERRFIQPGQAVVPGTVLLEPSSPQVEQEYTDAEAQLREAQAGLANLQAQLEDQRITQESVTADAEGQYLKAKTPYEVDLELSRSGLENRITLMNSRVAMEQLQKRFQLEQALEDARKPSLQSQLAAQHARIEQLETLVALRQEKVDKPRVRPGMDVVLQRMDVEVGRARVSDQTHASRVQVQVGMVSVSAIEVRSGLSEGDTVVLSDMSGMGRL